ncbi:octopamine receptor 2-like [Octopus sinensis]|uniref:Octopamine receptor 2-like n=1 Tax=Octopus sinensis TaxID=2607531 RepID=A0A7E6FKX0_9MOLL|nr:octopamine receptor 2-like [Octopus sinensis]
MNSSKFLSKDDLFADVKVPNDSKLKEIEQNFNDSEWLNKSNPCGVNTTGWLLLEPICSTRYDSFVVLLAVAIILGFIIVLTIFGNFMVLLALYKYKGLRTLSNCLIGNLAISDFLLSVTVLPISASYDVLGYWVFGNITCMLWLCIDVLYCTASIWGLCTIAVDRYTATVYPIWYQTQDTSKRAIFYIITVWLFSIVISIAPFIGWRHMLTTFFQFNTLIKAHDCILFMTQSFVLYSAFGSFIIPMFLMFFIYVRIFMELRKRSKARQAKIQGQTQFKNSKEKSTVSSPKTEETFEMHPLEKQTTNGNMWPTDNRQSSQLLSIETDESALTDDDHADKTATLVMSSESDTTSNAKLEGQLLKCAPETTDSERELLMVTSTSHSDSEKENCTAAAPAADSKAALEKSEESANAKASKTMRQRAINIISEFSKNDSKSRKGKHRVHTLQKMPEKSTKPALMNANVKRRFEQREQRATKRMALIMAIFCLCWMPFTFMYVIRSFCSNCGINPHLQSFIIWLGYVNSTLNPLLYTIFNEDFRKAFIHIILCRKVTAKF